MNGFKFLYDSFHSSQQCTRDVCAMPKVCMCAMQSTGICKNYVSPDVTKMYIEKQNVYRKNILHTQRKRKRERMLLSLYLDLF